MSQTWKDQMLHWNPTNYFDIGVITVTSDLIWLPEVMVKNSAGSGNDISLDGLQRYRISVDYQGNVRWYPPMTWVTTCKMDVFYFPFDKQTCQVVFSNSMYTGYFLNFTLSSNKLNLNGFHNHSEWLLESHSVSIGSRVNISKCALNNNGI